MTVSIIMLVLIPIVLALIFQKIDSELNIALNKKDVILFIVLGIIISTLYNIANVELHLIFILSYLIFMSYTDQKTQLVYTSVSLFMIIVEIINILIRLNAGHINAFIAQLLVLIIPVIMLVMSFFRGIGFGDVLIYTVIALCYISYKDSALFSMIYLVIIANVIFVFANLIGYITHIIRKEKDKSKPLTIYITISFFICNLLLI